MKVSEAIDRLEVGDTVWVKGKVLDFDRGGYDHCPLEVSLFYEDEWLHENAEISLTEPQAEKVEARLAEHWNEDIGDVLWWNFPVEEPPYCGTPLDEHFPKYKTHFSVIDMPNENEKPKRWVVKYESAGKIYYFTKWYQNNGNPFEPNGSKEKHYSGVAKFTDKSKAQAVAVLVEGSVEEV